MFEKEAEDKAVEKYPLSDRCDRIDLERNFKYEEGFKDGAEFAYNKANEWHYRKDVNCYEDLHFPPIEDCKGRICIWKVKDCSEDYHCGTYDDLRISR